jgi:Protein kinase domain
VEGQTLAARTSAGPLPPREALAIARQIAEALEAAHERNIVHRDLKPATLKRFSRWCSAGRSAYDRYGWRPTP